VPCSASRVVPGAHRVVGPGTHRGSGPREVHTTPVNPASNAAANAPANVAANALANPVANAPANAPPNTTGNVANNAANAANVQENAAANLRPNAGAQPLPLQANHAEGNQRQRIRDEVEISRRANYYRDHGVPEALDANNPIQATELRHMHDQQLLRRA
jgi:hypothetical protein